MLWQFLSRNMAILTLIYAIIAYVYPPAFLIFKDYFLWFFAATMLALGFIIVGCAPGAMALKHFQPETALPSALFAVWCIITAAAMTRHLHNNSGAITAAI